MVSFLGLIVFLLRLTLAIQSQMIAVLPADYLQGKSHISIETSDFQIHSATPAENVNPAALCEGEKEKNESESESLADLLQALQEAGFSLKSRHYFDPNFGNKALQGNLHLYDLFHSWKVHLS